ncbi:outer membrane protein [Sphingosinicella terrae]|jgi:outer membrane immunogenic protein|uniref:outer membrane protein n=1 Tax=Sphingosinicella terrae TaxID=2172047 RepID=UPI000E0DD7D0|nr:porin family protein [Sphingosinicella terrae]
MKKFAAILVAGVAFAGLATPASAAAVSGARVEALVGWDRASVDFDAFGLDDDVNSDGIVFGIGAGYDFAIGQSASIGIDVEATESSADLELVDGADSAEISVGRDLYAGGRVTFAVSPRTNIYLKAGYTNARISARVTDSGVTERDSANGDGIRGGIGAQFALGGNAYVGGEYRYSNYEADFSRHQAVATLGFRF